jgi:hypothetical protein
MVGHRHSFCRGNPAFAVAAIHLTQCTHPVEAHCVSAMLLVLLGTAPHCHRETKHVRQSELAVGMQATTIALTKQPSARLRYAIEQFTAHDGLEYLWMVDGESWFVPDSTKINRLLWFLLLFYV